ncbi:MAG TPA: hypothetical protein ENH13_02620 [Euryarchaeota archaeon]|nr:hypothetical protein [Euryarchaeota archaeon]
MNKTGKNALVIFIILISFLAVHAVENDYLAVTGQPKLTHTEKINSGDPYSAEVSLSRVGIIPRQSNLTVSTAAVNPIITLSIDGETQTFASQTVTQPLPESGVTNVEIKISGNAPTVSTDIEAVMLSVVTDVVYDDLNKGSQTEIVRSLVVTNSDIESAVRAINDAKTRRLAAETAVSDLKARGIDTTALETRLQVVRDMISDSESSKARGFPIEAKRQADNAIISLESIISDADSMAKREIDTKKIATVAVVIIIALMGISVLRRKREELG